MTTCLVVGSNFEISNDFKEVHSRKMLRPQILLKHRGGLNSSWVSEVTLDLCQQSSKIHHLAHQQLLSGETELEVSMLWPVCLPVWCHEIQLVVPHPPG